MGDIEKITKRGMSNFIALVHPAFAALVHPCTSSRTKLKRPCMESMHVILNLELNLF